MPELFIIAGPNGAGKTTASFTILAPKDQQQFELKSECIADTRTNNSSFQANAKN